MHVKEPWLLQTEPPLSIKECRNVWVVLSAINNEFHLLLPCRTRRL